MTKKQAREQRAAWREALADGRVVKLYNGMTLKSYPTLAARDQAITEYQAAGIPAAIVNI